MTGSCVSGRLADQRGVTGVRLEPVVFWPAGSASDLGGRVPGCCYGSLLASGCAGESRCVTGPGVVAGRSAPREVRAGRILRDTPGQLRDKRGGCGSIGGLCPPRARGPPMLPAVTLPAARYYVTPARPRRVCGRGLPGPRREARRREEPARDAAAGLAEVMAMPAIWRDAAGNLLELPGPGGGIVVCGALPGTAAPVPAWTAGELAAAGVAAAEPCPVRDGTGLGLVSCVTGPALIDEALAGRPREADPGYDLPAASSLSDADAFLQVKPFLRLLALLCGQVRPVPLPGVTPVLPAPGTPDGDRAALRLRPLTHAPGGPWRDGRWHGLRVLAKDGTVRAVADPKGADRKGSGGQSRSAAHFGRPASTGAPAAPQLRGVGGRAVPHRGDHPRRAPGARLRAGRPGPGRPRVPQQRSRRHQDHRREALRLAGVVGVEAAPLLAGPPPGVSVRVLDDGDGPPGGMCRQPDGTIRVEVSETVTIITSLTDPVAYPAGDIAELYGMRWASELVYLEEKQTLSAGQPVTAATPAGAYR